MKKQLFLIFLVLLAFTNLSGCISEDLDSDLINLSVNYQQTNGTIVESYDDGELISKETVMLDFDFSKTTSENQIITYGINTNDGGEPITVEASSQSKLTIEFIEHGFYHIDAYAIDAKGIIENISIFIRIDFRIEWIELSTNDPKILPIDPIPINNGTHPYMIEVSSLVENPSIIDEFGGGGQTVKFTWKMFDETNDACLTKNGQVEDGESDDWYIIHFNTYEVHELRIEYEEGQDYINIDQVISIIYDDDESKPNI
ncbi:MAG: hypothetical protein QF479_04135 [Candidatus Poseidoniaceae archaeon]|nr:hypothetical protein [Candidatus Poseidoniaceae archaeon]